MFIPLCFVVPYFLLFFYFIFVYDFSRPSLFLSTIFVCLGFHSLTGFFLFIDSPLSCVLAVLLVMDTAYEQPAP